MQDLKTNSKVSEDEPQQGITEKLAFTIHKIGCEVILHALVHIFLIAEYLNCIDTRCMFPVIMQLLWQGKYEVHHPHSVQETGEIFMGR